MSDERCPYCDGTGRIQTEACAQIVNGRRCRKRVLPDPVYYETYPERKAFAKYCGMHRNAYLRAMPSRERRRQPPDQENGS